MGWSGSSALELLPLLIAGPLRHAGARRIRPTGASQKDRAEFEQREIVVAATHIALGCAEQRGQDRPAQFGLLIGKRVGQRGGGAAGVVVVPAKRIGVGVAR